MEQLRNPYTPNAGARPPVIVGRDDQLTHFATLLARIKAGRSEQAMIIQGLRGVGKTVLLQQFRHTAEAENWAVIDHEVLKHADDDFRQQMAGWMRQALLTLSPRKRWSTRPYSGRSRSLSTPMAAWRPESTSNLSLVRTTS